MTDPNPQPATPAPLDAVVLAAGKGTRMKSDLPKVVHEVGGRPMVHWVLDAARAAGAERLIVVVGYRAELVREALAGADDVEFVEQTEQLGTGHAVMQAEPHFAEAAPRDVLVLAGDMPLLRNRTLIDLVEAHRRSGAAASLASGRLTDPTGYGRIIRDAAGAFTHIVEQKDASAEQLAVDEVNVSCYCFAAADLFEALKQVNTDNAQGEFYVTDVLGLLREAGRPIIAEPMVPADEVEGINNVEQLARVDAMLRQRVGEEAA